MIEEIVRDQAFLNEIYTLPEISSNWSTGNSQEPFKLETVIEDSAEWSAVFDRFRATNYSQEPNRIERIENPLLMAQYLLKKHKFSNLWKSDHKESLLFHGTKSSCIESICSKNFDWRLKGRSRGHIFGQGVSFSPDAYYASHFADRHVMILASVLIGSSTVGHCDTVIPPELHHTTDNAKKTVYVKYEDDDFYPKYVIYYD